MVFSCLPVSYRHSIQQCRRLVSQSAAKNPVQSAKAMGAVERTETGKEFRELYPEGRILKKGYHRVSKVHRLYYEVHGNPNGQPAVVLHGGPGAGCSTSQGRLFDLDFWKVILFDQRGCGKSEPRGLIRSNNMKKLVGDLEKIRYHLKIDKWLVFGGSHGATVALCYAQNHTSRVTGLVLRAVCLMRKQELDWLFSPAGVALRFPKGWQRFMSILEPNEQKNPIKAYYSRMLSVKDRVRTQAVRESFCPSRCLQCGIAGKLPQTDYENIPVKPDSFFAETVNMDRNINQFENRSLTNVLEEIKPLPGPLVQSLIEAHFFYHNKRFMAEVPSILDHVDRIRDVPCIAVHGEEDPICLQSNTDALKAAWQEMDLRIIPGGGHSQFGHQIRDATLQAIDEMKVVALEASIRPEFHDQAPSPTYPVPEPYYKKKYR